MQKLLQTKSMRHPNKQSTRRTQIIAQSIIVGNPIKGTSARMNEG